MNSPAARDYRIHGRGLRVRSSAEATASLLDTVFSAYVGDGEDAPDVTLDLVGADAVDLPEGARPLGVAEDGTHFEMSDRGEVIVRADGVGHAVIAADGRSARAGLLSPDVGWPTGHRLVEPVVVELLRTEGLFGLHAAAIARDGRGLLLCGRSGSGKSTAALALARSGWAFLGDDTSYLDRDGDAIAVRARWSDVHLTPSSLEVLLRPEERGAAHRPAGSEKFFLPVREFPGIEPAATCRARWLVFPRIVDRDASRLVPVGPAEALPELLAQSLVPGRPESVRPHFDILVGLCDGIEAYRLEAGRDLGGVVEAIQGLFDAA